MGGRLDRRGPEALHGVGYPRERLHFVQGPVEETLPGSAPESIALLRLDTDWYSSTKHELEHLYPRLVPGGVLIIDDYGTGRARAARSTSTSPSTGCRCCSTASTTPPASRSSCARAGLRMRVGQAVDLRRELPAQPDERDVLRVPALEIPRPTSLSCVANPAGVLCAAVSSRRQAQLWRAAPSVRLSRLEVLVEAVLEGR